MSRRFEDAYPALECLSLDGRTFHSSALNSLEEDFEGCGEVMQFNGGAGGASFHSQQIALGAGPGAPFDDDGEATLQELSSELPLQVLDFLALLLVVDVDAECVHPVVGGQTDGVQFFFESCGVGGLPGTGQTADEDEPRTGLASDVHPEIMTRIGLHCGVQVAAGDASDGAGDRLAGPQLFGCVVTRLV